MKKNLRKTKIESFGFTLIYQQVASCLTRRRSSDISALLPRFHRGELPALAKNQYPAKSGYMRVQSLSGFTLIELLITMAVIGLVIAAAIPAINTFNQNQLIANAQKDVQSLLRQAQSKALAAEVDRRFCDVQKTSLKGWYVGFDDSASSYKIFGKCISDQGRNTIAQFNQSTVYLPSDHVFANMPGGSGAGYTFYVMFQPASTEVWFYKQGASENGPLNCTAAVPPDPSQCYSPSRLGLASLTISNTKTGQTKIIEVYANGQIKGL